MDKDRYTFIDEAKALAMLVVVSWHILGIHSSWTDSWVMPIFFLIMGLFYKQDTSFKHMILKKINTLIIPLVFCSIPAFILSLYNHGCIFTLKRFFFPYECINPCSWFLICMFFCYVIYWLINIIAKDSKRRVVLTIIVSLIGFYSSQMHIFGHRLVLPFFISTALTMMFVIETGRSLRNYILNYKWGGIYMFILSTIVFVFLTLFFIPMPQNMIWSEYGTKNYLYYTIYSIVGSVWIIHLCHYIQPVLTRIAVIGRYSLLLLVLHSYIHSVLRLFVKNSIYDYLLTILFTVFISVLMDRYFPIITGKKQLFKHI